LTRLPLEKRHESLCSCAAFICSAFSDVEHLNFFVMLRFTHRWYSSGQISAEARGWLITKRMPGSPLAVLSVQSQLVSDWQSFRMISSTSAHERLPLGQRDRATKFLRLTIDESASCLDLAIVYLTNALLIMELPSHEVASSANSAKFSSLDPCVSGYVDANPGTVQEMRSRR